MRSTELGRYMRKTLLFLGVISLCLPALSATAQSFDASQAGGPVTINAAWRFHTGDDPQWASPDFDDSQWPLLRLDKAWAIQGNKGYYGYAWYRLKLKLPASKAPLALGFTELNSANEIYANGQLIGAIGKMRPAPVWLAYSGVLHSFPLPPALNGTTTTFAIRVWQPQESSNNYPFVGRTKNPEVGDKRTIDRLSELSSLLLPLNLLPDGVVSAVAAMIGLFSIGLFLLRRRSTEYAWAALFLFSDTAQAIGNWCYRAFLWPAMDWILAANCLEAATLIFWLLFIWRFLRAPADKLLRAGIILLLLAPVPSALAMMHIIRITPADLAWVIVPLAVGTLVCARLIRLALGGSREAQLLLLPFLLSCVMTSITQALRYLYYATAINTIPFNYLYRGPVISITLGDLYSLISYLAIAALLVLRFTRSAERDEHLSAEMAAAHRVQAQLVPSHLPATPHFHFDTAYLAAGEVGGDFYQVFLQPDGSVLVAIGDVSGKGLKAAMLGTLVVGAIHTLAQENLPPSAILARLNAQLISSADGGFVTCCVARIASDGTVTVANAAHLSPYLDGKEISLDSNLPLGIAPGIAYAESRLQLASGARLTFLSDGVVEARNPQGELFGFDRTAAIATQSAAAIAQAAQQHGQEDDITVLTLSRQSAGMVAPAPPVTAAQPI